MARSGVTTSNHRVQPTIIHPVVENIDKQSVKLNATRFPDTACSMFLQTQLNSLNRSSFSNELTVKEVFSDTKDYFVGEEGEHLKSLLDKVGIDLGTVNYRFRMIIVSQIQEGDEVLFFIMTVKEYESLGCVAIDYLDSLFYYKPGKSGVSRGAVYDAVINSYLDYAVTLGYCKSHIFVCSPRDNGSFLFNKRPKDMVIYDQTKLTNWYKKVLDNNKESVESYQQTLPSYFDDCKTIEEFIRNLLVSDLLRDMLIGTLQGVAYEGGKQLIFITLAKKQSSSTSTNQQRIYHSMTESRKSYMDNLERRKLEFDTLEKAKKSTAKIFELLLSETQTNKENSQ
ncbi:hypothetical protein CAEBREN_10524 [Caenorhabditis brenneri]|uniref:histone acetyltransferase n=1 Tax=Caenorhabditis brenneri TaxID=135651 RepID=G0NKT3_CAEBE|nr:hypothetical protein CAEBREN_10524 [Caenorhabditis brenneri]